MVRPQTCHKYSSASRYRRQQSLVIRGPPADMHVVLLGTFCSQIIFSGTQQLKMTLASTSDPRLNTPFLWWAAPVVGQWGYVFNTFDVHTSSLKSRNRTFATTARAFTRTSKSFTPNFDAFSAACCAAICPANGVPFRLP